MASPMRRFGGIVNRLSVGSVSRSSQLSVHLTQFRTVQSLSRPNKHQFGERRQSGEAATVEIQAGAVELQIRTPEGHLKPAVAIVGETLLDTAHRHNINLDGTCAGELACSTCHCVLGDKSVFDSMAFENPETEGDLLQSAWGVTDTSRLSCQVVVTPDMDGMELSFPSAQLGDAPAREALIKATEHDEVKIEPKKFRNITKSAIPEIFTTYAADHPELLDKLEEYRTLASILPFRTNNYVIEELIDWSNVPADPMFQLLFPQPGMLDDQADKVNKVARIRKDGATAKEIRSAANEIRANLNPHPAKQREMNVPNTLEDDHIVFERGMQHKYRETVLFFPSEAQYCHSYCTYCFRWAQFIGDSDTQFASNEVNLLAEYLRNNPNVSDLLLTGGDPMVLNSKQLGKYLDTIASDPTLDHVQTIRIGSKSLAYWPYKYVTDDDSDDMLRLLERVVRSGKHISFMAHFTHPAELSTPVVREAIRRLRNTGVQIRCQAPLIQHINDDPDLWATMWREQVKLGMIPYYMFVERDTGAKNWFGVPLARALEIYSGAIQQVSGLARTARGPSMSCTPGKVSVVGIQKVAGEKVFVLKFLQGRNPAWTDEVFFAKFDETASWMDDLVPAFGEEKFFFEDELAAMEKGSLVGSGSSGQLFQGSGLF